VTGRAVLCRVSQCDNDVTQAKYSSTASGQGSAIRHDSLARTTIGDESKILEVSVFLVGPLFLPAGHLRLNNLRYISSLSGQRAPRLDDLVGNIPSRCNC
jgi:hypothetical protein